MVMADVGELAEEPLLRDGGKPSARLDLPSFLVELQFLSGRSFNDFDIAVRGASEASSLGQQVLKFSI